MAIIKVHFDGSTTLGQEISVFQDEFVIGREDADLTIPHDTLISKRHARLYRVATAEGTRWVLEDLLSTNGTFAAIDQGVLRHGQEVLLGSRKYRFELPVGSGETEMPLVDRKQTSVWRPPTAPQAEFPTLVQIDYGQNEQRFELTSKDVKIGADPQSCQIAVTNDPFLSAEHARIRPDARGRWIIEPVDALNGVWARIRSIQVAKSALFQLGEQRISIRLP